MLLLLLLVGGCAIEGVELARLVLVPIRCSNERSLSSSCSSSSSSIVLSALSSHGPLSAMTGVASGAKKLRTSAVFVVTCCGMFRVVLGLCLLSLSLALSLVVLCLVVFVFDLVLVSPTHHG